MSNIIIYGGGTFSPVRNHLSLAAMSFGTTAKWLKNQLPQAKLRLTKMADSSSDIVTNLDVISDVGKYLCDPRTSVIVMTAALCDFHGSIGYVPSGHFAKRLKTRDCDEYTNMRIQPSVKVIDHIKALRPDIKIIGFKTTTGECYDTQVEYARRMDVHMVLANDTVTRENILVPQDHPAIFNSRANLLVQLAKHLNQPTIKFESDTEIWVQLNPNVYHSKWVAMNLAAEIIKGDDDHYFKQWHDQVEGLAIIAKGEPHA